MDTPSQFLKQQQKQQGQGPAQNAAQQQVPPISPVSSVQKEASPIAPVSEYVQSTEKTPPLEQGLKEAGVEPVENPEIPKLHVDVKNTGVNVSGEAMQLHDAQAASTIQLPTQEQILQAEKAPATDARKWLGYLYEIIAKRLGLWWINKQRKRERELI